MIAPACFVVVVDALTLFFAASQKRLIVVFIVGGSAVSLGSTAGIGLCRMTRKF